MSIESFKGESKNDENEIDESSEEFQHELREEIEKNLKLYQIPSAIIEEYLKESLKSSTSEKHDSQFLSINFPLNSHDLSILKDLRINLEKAFLICGKDGLNENVILH